MRKLAAWLAVLLFALWVGGLAGFLQTLQSVPEPGVTADLPHTDAIVVLTGGSERVTTGIELLESGTGGQLLISGVHRGLSLDGVLAGQPVTPDLRACCITLGYRAASTVGNAVETADWMRARGFRSLRLVTANYHMPRSLLLFRAALPDMEIVPYPVSPASVRLQEWWHHPNTLELLAVEYSKYLYANFRLTLARIAADPRGILRGTAS